MSGYHYTQKGRGLYTAAGILFAAVLAVLFFLARNPVCTAVGIFLVLLVMSGIYAFLKGGIWRISIRDGTLLWSYDRWPKSHGSIDMGTVRKIVVNDCSNTLSFTFKDGTRRKIKLIGYGARLRDYLKEAFPDIELEFIAGT